MAPRNFSQLALLLCASETANIVAGVLAVDQKAHPIPSFATYVVLGNTFSGVTDTDFSLYNRFSTLPEYGRMGPNSPKDGGKFMGALGLGGLGQRLPGTARGGRAAFRVLQERRQMLL